MDNLTAGNPRAHRIRVYYVETSTIYEGMPVCYEFDTLTNWWGGSVSDEGVVTASTAVAEATVNPARYIRVEDPDDDNMHAFAGVVAKGGWCGTSGAQALDIYVPNGADVPVRSGLDNVVGRTVLAIHTGEQELTTPHASNARCVAIAGHTETHSDGTPGLVLAKLDPNMFIFQRGDDDRLIIDNEDTTSDVVVNKIGLKSNQTGGRFTALEINCRCDAGGGCHAWNYGMGLHVETQIDATVAANVAGSAFVLNFTDGTPAERITAVHISLMESDCTMSSVESAAALTLCLQMTSDVAANDLGWLRLEQNGAQQPDNFILGSNLASLPATAFTGDRGSNLGTTHGDYAIKVWLAAASPQQWYIPLVKEIA